MGTNKYVCTICGASEDLSNFPPSPTRDIMEMHSMCFHCAFWYDKILQPDKNHEIIDGKYYIFDTILYPKSIIDRFGRKDICVIHRDGSVRMGNYIRLIGTIPPIFRSRLPDTAKYIPKNIFRNLEQDQSPCFAKGCWDRYHCYRYNYSAEPTTPWNTIPKSHIAGDERCYRFINKKNIPSWE